MFKTPPSAPLARRQFLRQTAAGLLGVATLGSWSWADESRLLVHTQSPMNAEPPLPELVKAWVTPVESFFIRSHGNTPVIDAASHRVVIGGLVESPLSLSLADLAKRQQHTVPATLTCAGNRRYEHSRVKPVKGVQWKEGAIGNAKWSGARLSDLLREAKLQPGAKHVWFEGLDRIDEGGHAFSFGGSIPLEKALLDEAGIPGALLATTMNGRALTADHGAPVRSLVPGYIGARSVKWLTKIVVADRPSPNHFVADVYKIVDEGAPLEVAETAPIYRMPLNAAICTPQAGANVPAGRITVAGYALPPGFPGASIRRVELSVDGGQNWTAAKLSAPSATYCWQLWTADVDAPSSATELIVRATDSRDETQPAVPRWNAKGYLYNGWHRVPLRRG